MQEFQSSINNSRSSAGFWRAVKFFSKKSSNSNQVNPEKWTDFYKSFLPPTVQNDNNYVGNDNSKLDGCISKDELMLALNKLKTKKAPGPDGIFNEFLINLPGIRTVA